MTRVRTHARFSGSPIAARSTRDGSARNAGPGSLVCPGMGYTESVGYARRYVLAAADPTYLGQEEAAVVVIPEGDEVFEANLPDDRAATRVLHARRRDFIAGPGSSHGRWRRLDRLIGNSVGIAKTPNLQ
jgi:hypothetical protein